MTKIKILVIRANLSHAAIGGCATSNLAGLGYLYYLIFVLENGFILHQFYLNSLVLK